MGWVCGMTGVGFILSGYLGGLFGWNMSQTQQILSPSAWCSCVC